MLKRLLIGLIGFGAVVLVAFGIYAYHSEIDPITSGERQSYDDDIVAKGKMLAAAGYCAECHTTPGNPPYSGNYPLNTGFGIIYGSNITPDPDHGIGKWSEEAFERAMKEGVDRRGRNLFPGFPYNHFTKMTEGDIRAIYAYIMTEVEPSPMETKDNTIPFPLNIRLLQSGWKLLFVDFGEYEPRKDKSDQWNRGAYLSQGLSHCGACHTPRNFLGGEKTSERYAGAAIDKWIAPALTASNASAVPWTAEELAAYLKSGVARYHGVAAGPMGPVVHAGLRELPDSDLEAISVYLADEIEAPDSDPAQNKAVIASLEAGKPSKTYRQHQGERLYATACASCHYNAKEVLAYRPDLAINSATRVESPDNLIQIILNGVNNLDGIDGVVMPAFRSALSDDEIVAIADYLRSERASLKSWGDLDAKRVSDIRNATSVVTQ